MYVFEEYKFICQQIGRLEARIKDMQDISLRSPSDTSGVYAPTNSVTSSTEILGDTLIELREELEKLYTRKIEVLNSIYDKLRILEDNEYKVAKARYIGMLTFEEVAYETGYSLAHVYTLMRSARKKIAF